MLNGSEKSFFLPNYFYHVYNRGVNREPIFFYEDNYKFLLRRVKEQAIKYEVSIIAYCLMPNHYHFLLRQNGDHPISGFIQAIFNSYTKGINKSLNRTGTLFGGPFEAILVEKDAYLLHLCRYIHRNPLDAKLVDHPAKWLYSNYLEWIAKRRGSLVDHDFIREFFPKPEEYERFVLDYTPPLEIETEVQRLKLE